ncbi:gliding motility-associated C-terminal domain-containing protein [Hymenobacter guriensis]|uniref:Gliding motility-associated C-terminal domain-containing protein n=1 Tax=Hymenobacter guriensis TaxID=2793065 RepID=A0ABS0KXL2_9BACT|nr:gliding motility-associated C-terminal domain-containing protein [Hymenobacter guriensis]MBG8552546.1 gliding motility-associated C-terminal domain-containing protein [Hymenobacter guriensis]
MHSAQATHIVGGELDLRHSVFNYYELTLNLYFDDINGSPDAYDYGLTAAIYAKRTNKIVQSVALPRTQDTFVAYTNPACEASSLRTRHLVYNAQVELTETYYADPAGYYVVVERCCRNGTINNIEEPGNAGQTFYLEFPAIVRDGEPFYNSSPRVFPPLSDYACKGELFYYDFAGTDPDGDSLVYEMATPLNGHATYDDPIPQLPGPAPYSLIRWLPGFSTAQQIPGNPALNIDRQTGRLQVRPSQLGLFVFSIRCSEYRDGVKIGEVRRDFQLKVISCPDNQKPNLTARLPGQTRAYQPGRDTLRLALGQDRCVPLRFTDPDAASRLTLSLHPVNFTGGLPTLSLKQGTVRTSGQPDTLTSQLCFAECIDTQGKVYLLDVVVADNGCSLPKRDTVRIAFIGTGPPNAPPTLMTTAKQPLKVRAGTWVTFDLLATDPDGDAVTLTMRGKDFDADWRKAELTQTPGKGQVKGTFRWQVPCPERYYKKYAFIFEATTSYCDRPETARVELVIDIDESNVPPKVMTTAPTTRLIIVHPGQLLSFQVVGTDADQDTVDLGVSVRGYPASSLGAELLWERRPGRSEGTFNWLVPCIEQDSILYNFVPYASSLFCNYAPYDTVSVPVLVIRDNAPPVLTSTAGPEPLRVRPGQLLSFDLLAVDPDSNAVTLTWSGQGFSPDDVGAQLTQQTHGAQQQGHFTWQVPCPVAGKSRYEFEFTATDVPCGEVKTAGLRVPVQIEDTNSPPTLSSSLFAAAPAPLLLRQLPGTTLEATLTGLDLDLDPLTLTARGVGFDLATAGMHFTAQNGAGQAAGTFRWDARCAEAFPEGYEVVFEVQEAGCQPQPRQQTVRFVVADSAPQAFVPPNIFTPNHDGQNEVFTLPMLPADICAQRFASIKVFNRWGKQVYASTDRGFAWNGGGLPGGVYFYLIDFVNRPQFKGYVTIAY